MSTSSSLSRHDLNLLVAFDALMTERNVTRAATLVGITQSTLSHNLGRLREMFDDELFCRTPGGVQPTPRAFALAPEIRAVLAAIQNRVLAAATFDPATSDRVFTIGMSAFMEAVLLPPIVEALSDQAPGVVLKVHSATTVNATDLLDEGSIDLGLGVVRDLHDRHRSVLLWTDRMAALQARDTVPPTRPMDVETYLAARHAIFSRSGGDASRESIDGSLMGQVRRGAVISTPHVFALPYMVRSTDMVATLPASLARQLAELHGLTASLLPTSLVTGYPIMLVWHASMDADPALRWLRAVAQQAAESIAEFVDALPEWPAAD